MRDVLIALTDPARAERIALSDALGTLTYAALARAVAQTAAALADTPPCVGLLLPRDRRHVIADLALASLGRTLVVLPDFFSPEQWRHMIADAGVGVVISSAGLADRLATAGVPVRILPSVSPRPGSSSAPVPLSPLPCQRIIYTSGTTGQPKGVRIAEAQCAASLAGLRQAVQAVPDDVHLSLLPFSLLLEQVAGLLLPLSVGARVHIAAGPHEAAAVGATTSVVVPALLAAWTAALRQSGQPAPASLRCVAVGGAPVGSPLLTAAWAAGLPAYEGYGLSECCSVVAVNRPGHNRPGTAGLPLPGLTVTLEDGEITVRGPTVMAGYLGGSDPGGVWRTGDLGRFTDDGALVVLGRRDDVIVTPQGRNVHPEWVEPLLLADPGLSACAVVAGPDGVTAALLPRDSSPSLPGWTERVAALAGSLPAYARPVRVVLIPPAIAAERALFTPDGRPRRRRIAAYVKEVPMSFYQALIAGTTADRDAFLSIPVIAGAVVSGVDRPLYLSFLTSAYHHVRYTVPLLRQALAACGPDDTVLAAGLVEYIAEETGHEDWILNDITALGGDAAAVRMARPPLPVRAMVAYAFHLIAEDGPYALLGMVHVLEGMSVALAVRAARAIRSRLAADGLTGAAGFSYLTSHGGLDIGHVDGFATLLDAVDTPARRAVVIAAAQEFYSLYGAVFRALPGAADLSRETGHAA